jgi:protein TonB
MNAVAANRPGATFSIRALALVLAALVTAIPLFLLLLGLSIKTAQAIRESRLSVDLIEIPPPPPPELPRPAQAHPAERAAAPAAAQARPASLVDQSRTPLEAPPAPAAADASAAGTGEGLGTGLGGDGPGGNGDGAIGGTVARVPVRGEASWIYKPDNAALMPFSPQRAGVEGVNGQVLLTCRVLRNRRVADCRVASERPRGYGFGRAAVEASRTFRLNPPTLDGEPDEARRVAIPVSFNNRR